MLHLLLVVNEDLAHKLVPACAPSPGGSPLPFPVQSACGATVSARSVTLYHAGVDGLQMEGDERKCDSLLRVVNLD